jgi:hypothetical protein
VPRVKLPFVAGQWQSRAKSVDVQETINYYPEMLSEDAKNRAVFIGTPGLQLVTTVANLSSPPRGLYTAGNGRMFYVNLNVLYEILPNGTYLQLSTGLLTTSGYVSMADNGIQLLIVDGSYGYVYAMQGNTLTKITDPLFASNPTVCSYNAGFFLVVSANSPYVYVSAAVSDTSQTLGPGAFSWPLTSGPIQKGSDSDNVVSIVSTSTYVWVFGQRTTELWYPTGTANTVQTPLQYPFARAQEMVLEVGCMAPMSVATNGSDVFWLGSNPAGGNIVWKANSYIPERITTHGEEYLIGNMGYIGDAIGACYTQEGHFFYFLTFPSGNRTHCYDMQTKAWHRRSHWNLTTGMHDAHLGMFLTSTSPGGFNNVSSSVYVADRRNGNIYTFLLNQYTDNGDYIHRVRTLSHTHKDQRYLYFSGVELDMQVGVGLSDYTASSIPTPSNYTVAIACEPATIPTPTWTPDNLVLTINGVTMITPFAYVNVGPTYIVYPQSTLESMIPVIQANCPFISSATWDNTNERLLLVANGPIVLHCITTLSAQMISLGCTYTNTYVPPTTTTTTTVAPDVSADPQMCLTWSKDGGFSWSKEHWSRMGKIGEYARRVRWPMGMGKSRSWVLRFSTMAAVQCVLTAAWADIDVEDV